MQRSSLHCAEVRLGSGRRLTTLLLGVVLLARPALSQTAATFDVDTRVPIAAAPNPTAVAVIIGNHRYRNADVPTVDYAARDAESVRRYATNALGVKSENVIFAEDATKATFERIFGSPQNTHGQLFNYLTGKSTDVYVFYSGHGAPDPDSSRAYLVPSDADPTYVSLEGYALQTLYDNLAKLPARSVTVFIDACFSGLTERGMLVRGASPLMLNVKQPSGTIPNGSVFSAAGPQQLANWDAESQHGLFTLFLLRGLQGEADANRDGRITVGELSRYLEAQIPSTARRLRGRDQAPSVTTADPNRVIATLSPRFASLPPIPRLDGAALADVQAPPVSLQGAGAATGASALSQSDARRWLDEHFPSHDLAIASARDALVLARLGFRRGEYAGARTQFDSAAALLKVLTAASSDASAVKALQADFDSSLEEARKACTTERMIAVRHGSRAPECPFVRPQ